MVLVSMMCPVAISLADCAGLLNFFTWRAERPRTQNNKKKTTKYYKYKYKYIYNI